MGGTLGHAQTNATQQMSNTVGVLVGWDLLGGWVSAVPGRLTATLAPPEAAEHVSITEYMGNHWFGVGLLRGRRVSRPGYCDRGTARSCRACPHYRTHGQSMVWGWVCARYARFPTGLLRPWHCQWPPNMSPLQNTCGINGLEPGVCAVGAVPARLLRPWHRQKQPSMLPLQNAIGIIG